MIKLNRVKTETRSRDIKRDRLLLIIGSKQFHLTRKEAKQLNEQLGRALYKL